MRHVEEANARVGVHAVVLTFSVLVVLHADPFVFALVGQLARTPPHRSKVLLDQDSVSHQRAAIRRRRSFGDHIRLRRLCLLLYLLYENEMLILRSTFHLPVRPYS